jgi:hypothetical protein
MPFGIDRNRLFELPQRPDFSRTLMRSVGACVLATYVFWNVYWLVQGHLAPSLFLATTGYPCPTTGCGRSLIQLIAGNFSASIRHNPFTLPFLFLLALTTAILLSKAIRRQRLVIPQTMAWSWWITLLAAWFCKLHDWPLK